MHDLGKLAVDRQFIDHRSLDVIDAFDLRKIFGMFWKTCKTKTRKAGLSYVTLYSLGSALGILMSEGCAE